MEEKSAKSGSRLITALFGKEGGPQTCCKCFTSFWDFRGPQLWLTRGSESEFTKREGASVLHSLLDTSDDIRTNIWVTWAFTTHGNVQNATLSLEKRLPAVWTHISPGRLRWRGDTVTDWFESIYYIQIVELEDMSFHIQKEKLSSLPT